MALTDPIADMLTVIRNASRAKKDIVEVKGSGLAEAIIKIFKENGFISNYKFIKDSKQGLLRIYLKYLKSGSPAILGIRRISKPGLRIYKKAEKLQANRRLSRIWASGHNRKRISFRAFKVRADRENNL